MEYPAINIDKKNLRDYQVEGVTKLIQQCVHNTGSILADDMGLGKTREAVAAAEALKHEGVVLVVCPASVREQWAVEINNLTPAVAMLLGPKATHKTEWAAASKYRDGYLITSWNLMEEVLELIAIPRIIILDEAHDAIASRYNKWGEALMKYRRAIDYCIIVTGTPYQSKPAGLWMQLHVIANMKFGKAREFDARYCGGHEGQWGWVNNGATNTQELATRLSNYMVRRTKSEVHTELPPVTTQVRWVDGTKAATTAFHKFAQAKHDVHARNNAVKATLVDKMPEVVNIAKTIDTPTVIFTWMQDHCEELADLMRKKKLRAHAIHGASKGARSSLIAAAIEDKAHIVITYGAGGTGLDGLQKYTSYGIVHAINPSPPKLLQMMARLDRLGQTLPVTWIYTAMKDSIDQVTVDNVVRRFDHWRQLMGYDPAADAIKDGIRSNVLENEEALINEVFNSLPDTGYDGGE